MNKKIAIAVAVVLMLSGVAVSAMKTLKLGPFAELPGEGEDAETATAAVEPPRFVDMEVLIIPVITGDRVATTIQIQIKLETVGAANETKIQQMMPRLNDAFVRDLHSFIPRLLGKNQQLDVGIIKQRLQAIGDKVVGPGTISAVLVQGIADAAARPERPAQ